MKLKYCIVRGKSYYQIMHRTFKIKHVTVKVMLSDIIRRSHVLHQVSNRTVTVGVLMYANAYNMCFTNHAAIRPETRSSVKRYPPETE